MYLCYPILKIKCLQAVPVGSQQSLPSLPKQAVSVGEELVAQGGRLALPRYGQVLVERLANKQDAALDLLELTFREQYLSRSDMCRLRRYVRGRCLRLDAQLEFCLMRLRVNIGIFFGDGIGLTEKLVFKVRELWRKGECVTSGQVDENTRVVFRSSSALMFIFVQMSAEMWDYDTQVPT